MKAIKTLQKLCAPAQLYLGLSIISILAILMQNLQDPTSYTCGSYTVKCPVHNGIVFALKLLYVLGWTTILHYLCKSGYTNISWFLVLLPFISMFILIGMAILFLI